MAKYLTEIDYQSWLRQYYTNVRLYLESLIGLRVRLEELADSEEAWILEIEADEAAQRIEQIEPRDFVGEKPLTGVEKFFENLKVLYNIIQRVRGKEDRYLGIYQEEKNKVLRLHRELSFRDQYRQLAKKVFALEKKYYEVKSQENALEELLGGSTENKENAEKENVAK